MNENFSEKQAGEFQRIYKNTRTVVLWQIALTLILVALGWYLAAETDLNVPAQSLKALRILVFILAIGALFLRRFLNRKKRLESAAGAKGSSGLLKALRTNAIILGAIAQAIGLIGFLIASLGGIKNDSLYLGAISLLIFLFVFPRKDVWTKIVTAFRKDL